MSLSIEIKNLSKSYRLGEIGTGTLSRDLERWIARFRGKEDPYMKIGEVNDRTTKGSSDIVWSLNDVSFNIEKGEALGIIGRNGAGKSTLLKLLSRVTSPTCGEINIKGRVASLLEVGTGFHPELTGKENIYLNGAILGMRRREIRQRFDEIVDFAGIQRYIDTPVKRYSSGMYVRLAFSVAAHLESEILIVDEVLAVGDADFQKKCITKMEAVARQEGRTILFVSHDLKAVSSLCSSCVFLKNGQLEAQGTAAEIIKRYALDRAGNAAGVTRVDSGLLKFRGIQNESELNELTVESSVNLKLLFMANEFSSKSFFLDIGVHNENGEMIIHSKTKYSSNPFCIEPNSQFAIDYYIERPSLAPGNYNLTIYAYEESIDKKVLLWIESVPAFIINSNNPNAEGLEKDYLDEIKSYIYPKTKFSIYHD